MMFSTFTRTKLSGRQIVFRYIHRFLAALILIPFTILVALLKLFAAIYRFVAIPVVVIVSGIAVYFCIRNGFAYKYINPIVGSIIGVGIHYLLPTIVLFLDDLRDDLKEFVVTPTIVRSRMKFVL